MSKRVRKFRESLLEAGTVVAHADSRSRELSPVAIGNKEGLALGEWVGNEGALRTLETGLGFGISTLFICEALLENGSDGRHVATDPYQFSSLPLHRTTYLGVGLQILEEVGVRDLVEFYAEESQIVLPRLLAGAGSSTSPSSTDHRFEGVFLDLIHCGRLLKEGGIVFVDDTQLPGVRCAVGSVLPTSAGSPRMKETKASTNGSFLGPVRATRS